MRFGVFAFGLHLSEVVLRFLRLLLWLFASGVALAEGDAGADRSMKAATGERVHPQLVAAKETQDDIRRADQNVLQTVEQLAAHVDKTDFSKLGDEDAFFKTAKDTVRELRTHGEDTLALHTRYSDSLGKLEETLKMSVPELRRVAQLFKDLSTSETYQSLGEFYLELQGFWLKYADQCAARAAKLSPERLEVAESLRFVNRSIVLLRHLEAHLDAIGTPSAGADRTMFLKRLREYVKAFELLRKTMKKATDSLQVDGVSDATKAEAQRLASRFDDKVGPPVVKLAPDPNRPWGALVEISDGKAAVNLGLGHRLAPGDVLTIYRGGAEFGQAVVEIIGEAMVRIRSLAGPLEAGDVAGFAPATPSPTVVVAAAGVAR